MNQFQKAINAAKSKILLKYHRVAARLYLKWAAYHADQVIYTRYEVPTQDLRFLRRMAEEHTLRAQAIRKGV
ncbi:TPA: hypothetical protein ACP32N_003186 [Pseudomonas aeruginosa]